MTQLRGAFNFELTQFGDLERQMNKQPDIQDSGAPMMKMLVRDLDRSSRTRRKSNAPIVTKGGDARHGADADRQREGDHHARP